MLMAIWVEMHYFLPDQWYRRVLVPASRRQPVDQSRGDPLREPGAGILCFCNLADWHSNEGAVKYGYNLGISGYGIPLPGGFYFIFLFAKMIRKICQQIRREYLANLDEKTAQLQYILTPGLFLGL